MDEMSYLQHIFLLMLCSALWYMIIMNSVKTKTNLQTKFINFYLI